MKTLNDLSIGDVLYAVRSGRIDIEETKVFREITKKPDGTISVYHEGERLEEKSTSTYFTYKSYVNCFYFINESEAIRYSKLQLIKDLNQKISDAKNAIKIVKDFRKVYWEALNLTHTDRHIAQLEKELK